MSLIIASLLEDAQRAIVAVDTAARSVECGDLHHTSKMIPFVQANAVLAGRGNKRFLIDVYANLFNVLGRWSVDDAFEALASQAVPMYANWERLYRAEGKEPDSGGQELVFVGWSAREQKFKGLVLECRPGTSHFHIYWMLWSHVTPWDSCMGVAAIVPESIRAVTALAQEQIRFVRRVSPKTPIGGVLIVADMRVGEFRVTQTLIDLEAHVEVPSA
jgi:hypothetical protein